MLGLQKQGKSSADPHRLVKSSGSRSKYSWPLISQVSAVVVVLVVVWAVVAACISRRKVITIFNLDVMVGSRSTDECL